MWQSGEANKETIIFIHGVIGNHAAFKKEFQILSKSYRVISFDLIGYGPGAVGRSIPVDLNSFVNQLNNIYDHFGVDSAHLCSLSYGSYITNLFTSIYPEKVLSLCHVGGYYNNPSELRNVLLQLWEARNDDYLTWAKRYSDSFNPIRNNAPYEFIKRGRSQCFDFASKLHPSVLIKSVDIQLNFDIKSIIQNIKHPTLWIMGEDDVLFKSPLYDLTFILPNVKFFEIEKAGHVAHKENPEEFMNLYLNFLREL